MLAIDRETQCAPQQIHESEPPVADVVPADASENGAGLNIDIEFVAGVWLPRLGGDAKLDSGAGGSDIDVEHQLDLHDVEPTLALDLTLGVPDVAFRASGFAFSTEGDGTFQPRPSAAPSQQFGDLTLTAGDAFESDFDMWSAAIEVQLRVFNIAEGLTRDNENVSISLIPILGARWLRVEQSITVGGTSEDADAQWIFAQIGGALALDWRLPIDMPLVERVSLHVASSFGPALSTGKATGSAWEVRGGLSIAFTDNIAGTIGYRLVNVNAEDDDYELDAGLQGLFFAGSIRF